MCFKCVQMCFVHFEKQGGRIYDRTGKCFVMCLNVRQYTFNVPQMCFQCVSNVFKCVFCTLNVKPAVRGPSKAKSTLSTPRYPTSHSNQKPGVGSSDASRRVGLGLRWTLNKNNYCLNDGRYCEQQQQQQRQLTVAGGFKFNSTQTAIGWIVSPRSPLVDGTYS